MSPFSIFEDVTGMSVHSDSESVLKKKRERGWGEFGGEEREHPRKGANERESLKHLKR